MPIKNWQFCWHFLRINFLWIWGNFERGIRSSLFEWKRNADRLLVEVSKQPDREINKTVLLCERVIEQKSARLTVRFYGGERFVFKLEFLEALSHVMLRNNYNNIQESRWNLAPFQRLQIGCYVFKLHVIGKLWMSLWDRKCQPFPVTLQLVWFITTL